MGKEVQDALGNFDEVRRYFSTSNPTSSLIGVARQPSTPISTKPGGKKNPFDSVRDRQPSSAESSKHEAKSLPNGHYPSKTSRPDSKHVKKPNSASNKQSNNTERDNVFDKFNKKLEHSDQTKTDNIQNSKHATREHIQKEHHKRRSSEKDGQKRRDQKSHHRDRSKSKSEGKRNHNVGVGNDARTLSETKHVDTKVNGVSSAASTPNSQKSTGSSGYGSSKPPSSVASQPHVSPSRDRLDSESSVKSPPSPSPGDHVFQSPKNRVSGKLSHSKHPNGLSNESLSRLTGDSQSRNKVLKLHMPNQVRP